ncbi:hypothetical protein PSPO01_16098 [Paraphaeosphaeria sporulosa]
MPRLPTLHSYVKALREEGRRGMLADDPSLHCLLGFEKDNVESRPVKTYIRRLWLAFQSSKHSSMPRYFLDPVAETFSKEVEAQVSDFVEDPDRLASEIAKDPLVVDEKTKETRSAFLDDTAQEDATDLVVRESVDMTEEATRSRRREEHALRRRSTRRRKPSARAIDIGGLQSTCTDTIVTKLRSVSQAGQRQCVPAGLFEISSLSHPRSSAAPSRSPDEHSDDIKFNNAVIRMTSVAPSSSNRGRGVKRRRTASTEGEKPAKLLPTPAPSVVTLQDPRTSRSGSNNPRGRMSQIRNMISRDWLDGDRDP